MLSLNFCSSYPDIRMIKDSKKQARAKCAGFSMQTPSFVTRQYTVMLPSSSVPVLL